MMEFQNQYMYIPPSQPSFSPDRRREDRRTALRVGLALFLYLMIATLVQGMIQTVCTGFFTDFTQSEAYLWLIQCVPSYLIAFPLFCLFLSGLPKERPTQHRLGGGDWVGFLAISFLLMLVGELAASFTINIMEFLRGSEISNLLSERVANSSPLMNLIVVALIAPVVEELMFRKLLIDCLLPYSECFAVLTGGLLFGLIHGNFYQFFYAALLGLLFSFIYVKTGRIRYTIGMHIIVNFTGAFINDLLNDLVGDAEYSPWHLIAVLYQLAILALAVCGVIFLVRGIGRLTLSTKNARGLTFAQQLRFGWLNAGMILFGVLIFISFVGSIFFV